MWGTAMTEEQRIAAIDALVEECLWTRTRTHREDNYRDATINALRVLHSDGNLNVKDVYEFLITGFWHNATEEQKLKCENAVQAMREVLAEES
jgi:hypothetical protein